MSTSVSCLMSLVLSAPTRCDIVDVICFSWSTTTLWSANWHSCTWSHHTTSPFIVTVMMITTTMMKGMSEGLTSHLTYNKSLQRQVFPGNRLHCYWQRKTKKQNTTHVGNTKETEKLPWLTKQGTSWFGMPFMTTSQERSGPYSDNLGARTEQYRKWHICWWW